MRRTVAETVRRTAEKPARPVARLDVGTGCAGPNSMRGVVLLTSFVALVAPNGTRWARFLNRASHVRIMPGAQGKFDPDLGVCAGQSVVGLTALHLPCPLGSVVFGRSVGGAWEELLLEAPRREAGCSRSGAGASTSVSAMSTATGAGRTSMPPCLLYTSDAADE